MVKVNVIVVMKTWQHRVLQRPTLVPFAVTSGWCEGYRIRPRYKESNLRGHTNIYIFKQQSLIRLVGLDFCHFPKRRQNF